jgi:hypothetical protein
MNSNHLKKVFDELVAEHTYIRYDNTTSEITDSAYTYMLELVESYVVGGYVTLDFMIDELHVWTDLSDLEIANLVDELECIKEEREGD